MDSQPSQFNPVTEPQSNKNLIVAIVSILVAVAIGAGAYWYFTQPKPIACTQEAKQCSDGTIVGRTGPNCEFAACPTVKIMNEFLLLGEVEKPEYFDNQVSPEEQFYYKIEAIDINSKVVKSYEPVAVKIPQSTTIFNNAKDLWAWSTENYVNLKWDPYDFKKFKVYRDGETTAEISGWQTYRNEEHGFEIKYLDLYKIGVAPQLSEMQKNLNADYLIYLKHPNDSASISIWLITPNFNLQTIKQWFAPTGVESLPEKKDFGYNTFYYYGPGGGGISYPDNYFFDLTGMNPKTLIITFDGPYINDKTPSEETKKLETKILSTFKFTN